MIEHIDYVYTIGMTDSEVDECLHEGEAGVLALANGGRAYAVPASYYYDGLSLFFRLGDDEHSKKHEFIETTDEACFLLYGIDAPGESWSIIATGTLREVADPERAGFDAATINERFGSLRVFDEAIDEIDLALFELDIETITGRRTTS